MFGFGRRHRKGMGNGLHKRHGQRENRGCRKGISLDNCEVGERYMVKCNSEKQLLEMGLHPGAVVTVHKNDKEDNNIVIAIGDSRFIVPRETAKQVIVR